MSFPYSEHQIEGMLAADKHPRDWILPNFSSYDGYSLEMLCMLERGDGRDDRIRLVVRAGVPEKPTTYKASLLLEDSRVRGIDYHYTARSRFYRETIPAGWHEDIVNPNLTPDQKGQHQRISLSDFEPYQLDDFLRKVCMHWNITLPPTSNRLL